MPKYETTLTRSETVAEGTMAFHFAKPEGFKFTAGQSMNVSLIEPPETDAKGNSRTFSIVSAPHESELVIATRMRDTAFKRVLKSMPAGGRVGLRGPAGLFTLGLSANIYYVAGPPGLVEAMQKCSSPRALQKRRSTRTSSSATRR